MESDYEVTYPEILRPGKLDLAGLFVHKKSDDDNEAFKMSHGKICGNA